jgi:hypothetical protein
MPKHLLFFLFCIPLYNFGQVCIGCGNSRIMSGVSFQKKGIGGQLIFDYGVSNFLSYGIGLGYTFPINSQVNTEEIDSQDLVFEKADFNFRGNMHLGSAIRSNNNFDIYTGVNVGFRNCAGRMGVVFNFNEKLGIGIEGTIPIYKYSLFKTKSSNYYEFYNQPYFNVSFVFNN